MKNEVFKLEAIVEQQQLDDELMAMVMGGVCSTGECSPKLDCNTNCNCMYKGSTCCHAGSGNYVHL